MINIVIKCSYITLNNNFTCFFIIMKVVCQRENERFSKLIKIIENTTL